MKNSYKGYARVSTKEQNLDRQVDKLLTFGVPTENIYCDKVSGQSGNRSEFKRLLSELKDGDTVIVTDLTRIGRSTIDILKIVEKIKTTGASIKSIDEPWLDTTADNPLNEFLLTLISGLSQLERKLIVFRVKQGLESARARGRVGGRPKLDQNKVHTAMKMYFSGNFTTYEICNTTGIGRSSLFNYCKKYKDNPQLFESLNLPKED